MILQLNSWLRGISRYFTQNDAALPAVSLTGQLRWKLRHWLPMLGWPGVVAIGLLAICLPFYLSTIRPMQARIDVAQHNAHSVREQALNTSNTVHGGSTPIEQLAEFYKFFPTEKNSPLWLEKLVSVAEKNGLSLNDGEYKVTQDKVGQLLRYKITLPVRGKYPQIRKFLVSLNTEMPIMALENVQFERENIIDSAVQAKIKLVLYLVQES
jgi:hypothetical protein